MTKLKTATVILPLLLGGCDIASNKDPVAMIERRIDRCAVNMGQPYGVFAYTDKCYYVGEILKDIASLTNKLDRARLLEDYAHRLMSVDFQRLNYRSQEKRIRDISYAISMDIIPSLVYSTDTELNRVYNLRFEYLEWLRAQLHRLRPQRKRKSKKYSSMEESRRDCAWKTAYFKIYHNLRSQLFKLESPEWMIDRDLERRPNERREDIIKKVETWLGHPLRSKEELLKFSRYESEDYKKVRSSEYEPLP